MCSSACTYYVIGSNDRSHSLQHTKSVPTSGAYGVFLFLLAFTASISPLPGGTTNMSARTRTRVNHFCCSAAQLVISGTHTNGLSPASPDRAMANEFRHSPRRRLRLDTFANGADTKLCACHWIRWTRWTLGKQHVCNRICTDCRIKYTMYQACCEKRLAK